MMIYKERTRTHELVVLESLNQRMDLPKRFEKKLVNLQTGHRGEEGLDPHTASLGEPYLVLNDLRLPTADEETTFQLDALVITPDALLIYEVKNFTGSYYFKDGRFYTSWHYERKNPSTQASDAGMLLRQLLHKMKIHYDVKAFLVFINPGFMLYNAPMDESILLHGQLDAHFQSLRQRGGARHAKQEALAKMLLGMHVDKYKYSEFPDYDFASLRKGIACAQCGSLRVEVLKRHCICQMCGNKEVAVAAICRQVEEFRLLFPDSPITSRRITEWCGFSSQQRVSRVLRKYYTLHGYTHRAFYK